MAGGGRDAGARRAGRDGGGAKRPKQRDPQAWEEEGIPRMEERQVERARMDPAKLAKMRADAKKKLQESRGVDPATLTRMWDVSIAITGVENTTSSNWEVFMAAKMGSTASHRTRRGRMRQQYKFTRSYVVKAGEKKQFKSMEMLISKRWEGSYKELQHNEVVIDVWMVSKTNFNQMIGTSSRSLYDLGSDSVFQTMMVKPNQGAVRAAADVGVLHINAVVSEIMRFTIVASNWQFSASPEFAGLIAPCSLRLELPTANKGPVDVFRTGVAAGPRYCWPKAGQFVYEGTLASLSTEAIFISVLQGGKLRGRAVLGMSGAGDYPIATGVVKQLSQNASQYIQGRVAGSLAVSRRSLLLKEGTHDEDSSIRPPEQPSHSLVLSHLSPSLQYLVVEVMAAHGLPVADADTGSSNAFCRVKYDGSVQRSLVVEASLSPSWNHVFYLPVRLTDEAIRTDERYYKKLLPLEMQSKGELEIEVWHWDSVPTEFLGASSLDLHELLHCRAQPRALCQTAGQTSVAAEGDGEALAMGVHPALARKHSTKVYEGRREALGGSWLQSATRATISFDCYFLPDFPVDFKFAKQAAPELGSFAENFQHWERLWPDFCEAYAAWFPEAPPTRRFLCRFSDAAGAEQPLPRLIRPLALPASLAEPLKVQHWVRCTEFCAPARQRSAGQIGNWQRAEDVLGLRRGSVQDHAVLLCCALLGLGKHAFVCKGTVQGGREHAWVMTLEQLGVVTFWETTTGGKFHLPGRWIGDASHGDACKRKVEERWRARRTSTAWREQAEQRKGLNRAELLSGLDELVQLPISPWRELYREGMLVAVPYESVEVVFNGFQLWGNQGNHHPGCIYYDMEDDARSWVPLLGEAELRALACMSEGVVPVGPAISKHTAEELQDVIEAELKECVSFIRVRQGHESYFENDEVLQETLEGYLLMLETECQLDSDWCYNSEDQQAKPWGVPSPFNSFTYVQRCRTEWSRYWKARRAMDEARAFLPVRENHVLSGVPLHVSSTDIREIRRNILACAPIQEYFNLPMDDVLYFACAKVFPMPSSVNSVWIFMGAEVPLSPEKVYELARTEVEDTPVEAGEEDQGWDVTEEAEKKQKRKQFKE